MTAKKFPALIVDVALRAEGQVLFVRHADVNRYDHPPGWFLPDDGIGCLEHPDRAVRRVLQEQLGLAGIEPRLHHVESFRGNNGAWHIPFHYLAELEKPPALRPSKDVKGAKWFDLRALPTDGEPAHHGWARTTLEAIGPKR